MTIAQALHSQEPKGLSKAVDNAAHQSSVQKEIHAEQKSFSVDFENFFGYRPNVVDRKFWLTLSDLSYLPKIGHPTADWVVTAAANAFVAYQEGKLGVVKRFASVGTGSGTDTIVALDVFPKLSAIALTDLHTDVVEAARRNVLSATEKAPDHVNEIAENAVARAGDVLRPLQGQAPFDLIYENLPNIPLADSGDLAQGQTSSTYVGDRTLDQVPAAVTAALLDLHWVCLRQARMFNLLAPGGALLSSMGGRVPTSAMLALADSAGYEARILTLSWKEQSEPEAVIGGYAEHQEQGLGPFYFYPVSALRTAFSKRSPASAALFAAQVEAELLPHRLDAVTALQRHRSGVEIGHTVVVMASVLKALPN